MNETLNVAIVGYGFAAKTFHAPLIAGVAGLELAAIASSDAAKVRADWPEVVVCATPAELFARPDIDLVVIPTPNDSHFPLARMALAAGKHVVVDKPFTVTVTDARCLQAEAAAAGRLLSVFHNRRWDSDFLTPVSYTHLDVYKRQVQNHDYDLFVIGAGSGGVRACLLYTSRCV